MKELYRSKDLDIVELLNLGRALAAAHGHSAVVITARDGLHVSRLAKRAMVIGVAYGGTSVLDLRLAPEVLVSFNLERGNGDAGFYVSYGPSGLRVNLHAREEEQVLGARILELLRGGNLPQVPLSDLGDISLYPNATEDYARAMHKRVDFLRNRRILADFRNMPISLVALPLLESYGMKVTPFNDILITPQEPRGKDVFLRVLQEGRFDLGVRFLEGSVELYLGDGRREEFQGIEALLKRLSR